MKLSIVLVAAVVALSGCGLSSNDKADRADALERASHAAKTVCGDAGVSSVTIDGKSHIDCNPSKAELKSDAKYYQNNSSDICRSATTHEERLAYC